MKPPVSIVEDPEFRNTTDFVEWLAQQQSRKQLVGVAAIVMLRGREIHMHSTGEMNRNPDFAISMVMRLLGRFWKMVHGK